MNSFQKMLRSAMTEIKEYIDLFLQNEQYLQNVDI